MKTVTIIARNYLAQARVLAESYAAHHPGKRMSVLVLDDVGRTLDSGGEAFDLIHPSDLDISTRDFHRMAAIYNVMELATALKPWLLRHVLAGGAATAVYLDPDIEVFAPLDELDGMAREHEIVLTPHTVAPMPRDGLSATESDILKAGVYNLGFIAVSAAALPFLSWWSERLEIDCVISAEEGFFVDQRWIDFIPGYFKHLTLKDPSYNVAYWNLSSREVTWNGSRYEVDGGPLRFFHYSGYSPETPFLLSKHQGVKPRILLSEQQAVHRLCSGYGENLRKHGYQQWMAMPYGYDQTGGGFRFNDQIRRICRNYGRGAINHPGIIEFDMPDPFDPDEAEAFLDWLNTAAPWSPNPMISRFLQGVYDERYDLRVAFPKIWGPDADRYLAWAVDQAVGEKSFPLELLPGEPPEIPAASCSPDELKPGVNVAGYMNSANGLGEAARLLVSVLEAGGIPHAVVPPFGHTQSRQDDNFAETGAGAPEHDVSVVCINADQLQIFANHVGPGFMNDRYTVGFWAWEVEVFPGSMARNEEFVDEIWVYSEHTRKAISAVVSKPVFKCPLPIAAPEPPPLSREHFGLPESFMFLFCFDYFSVMERKNPLAVIEAFKQAFAPDEGPLLVIKSINGEKCLVDREKLRAAAAGRPDIRLMEGYLSRDEQQALMNVCDAYVSLHRCEGFGLTMGEAMAMGKPVIATAYSGNLEFMDEANSFLVPYKMIEVPPGCDPYPAGSRWAHPDYGAAAAFMRRIYDNPEAARVTGDRARRDVIKKHGPGERTRFVTGRLESIRNGRRVAVKSVNTPAAAAAPAAVAVQEQSSARDRAAANLASGPDPDAPTGYGNLGRFARKAAMRLIRQYDLHQRQTGELILRALDELEAGQAASAARQAGAQERFWNLERELERLNRALSQVSGSIKSGADPSGDVTAQLEAMRISLSRIEAVSRQVEGLDRDLGRLVGQHEAVPFSSDPGLLETMDSLGRPAMGYRDLTEAGEHAELSAGFLEVFRGSEELIRQRQRFYLDALMDCGSVLDLGCGRGEMLELLAEAGVSAAGVEIDEGLVRHCLAKGLDVRQEDALEFLAAQPDGSVGAIFSAQFIEHLDHGRIIELMRLTHAKLQPGGVFVTETVNPHSVQAMKVFWVDLTHQKPVFPETALVLHRLLGFQEAIVYFPNGSGDLEADRLSQGEYAVIAVKSAVPAGHLQAMGRDGLGDMAADENQLADDS